MSDKILEWPKGATHVRITAPDGKKQAVVEKDGAAEILKGIPGTLVFLVKVGKKDFQAFAGDPIPNPYAEAPKAAPQAEASAPAAQPTTQAAAPAAEQAAVQTAEQAEASAPAPQPAAEAPKAEEKAQAEPAKETAAAPEKKGKGKGKGAKAGKGKSTKSAKSTGTKKPRSGKTAFIIGLMDGKLTARQIAEKVVAKYPEAGMKADAQFEKALRFVRACTWHAGQKGIKAHYKSEITDRKEKKGKK